MLIEMSFTNRRTLFECLAKFQNTGNTGPRNLAILDNIEKIQNIFSGYHLKIEYQNAIDIRNIEKWEIVRTLELIGYTNQMILLQYELDEGDFFDSGAVIGYQQVKKELISGLQDILSEYNLKVDDVFRLPEFPKL